MTVTALTTMPILAYPRRRVAELMDQPDLPEDAHLAALAGLGRVSAVSRTAAALWNPIRAIASTSGAERPLRILDIASGGGHLPIALSRLAARDRLSVEILGCDISSRAVAFAETLAARAKAGRVAFDRIDALAGPIPSRFDVVCTSLFLHHLDDDDAVRLLRAMGAAASQLVLVSDLRRTRLGYAFAWAGSRMLSRSRVVHVDGPRSVDAAFTTREIAALAACAGLAGAAVSRHWPQRWVLSWRRSS